MSRLHPLVGLIVAPVNIYPVLGVIVNVALPPGDTLLLFTGNPNNWVSFAGKLWRIIRINGNGSVRLLYLYFCHYNILLLYLYSFYL